MLTSHSWTDFGGFPLAVSGSSEVRSAECLSTGQCGLSDHVQPEINVSASKLGARMTIHGEFFKLSIVFEFAPPSATSNDMCHSQLVLSCLCRIPAALHAPTIIFVSSSTLPPPADADALSLSLPVPSVLGWRCAWRRRQAHCPALPCRLQPEQP